MNGFFDFGKDGFGFIIIFVVTGVLILCVAALNKMSARGKRSADKRNAGKNK